jgi:hypothetical protein
VVQRPGTPTSVPPVFEPYPPSRADTAKRGNSAVSAALEERAGVCAYACPTSPQSAGERPRRLQPCSGDDFPGERLDTRRSTAEAIQRAIHLTFTASSIRPTRAAPVIESRAALDDTNTMPRPRRPQASFWVAGNERLQQHLIDSPKRARGYLNTGSPTCSGGECGQGRGACCKRTSGLIVPSLPRYDRISGAKPTAVESITPFTQPTCDRPPGAPWLFASRPSYFSVRKFMHHMQGRTAGAGVPRGVQRPPFCLWICRLPESSRPTSVLNRALS